MRLNPLRPPAILSILAAGALLLAACQNGGGGSTAPSSGAALQIPVSHTAAADARARPQGKTLCNLTQGTGRPTTCTTRP